MKEYEKFFEAVGLPEQARELARGGIVIPNGMEEQPSRCYGFPPALVPFWSSPDGMIYTGYWKHWFVERESSFVQMYINVDFRVKEISRTFEQFSQYLVLKEIVFADEVTDEIISFAGKLGVDDVDELDQVSLESGDEPAGLLNLEAFRNGAPLICYEDTDQYSGGFPHMGMPICYEAMSRTCSLELNERLEAEFRLSENCPEWFRANNKKELFDRYLFEQSYAKCWFTLNSNGWSFTDARNALSSLGKAVNDPLFSLLVEAWCSLDHTQYKLSY